MTRWEVGEARPSRARWSSIAAFFVRYAPEAAVNLAAAAGVSSPVATPPSVDNRQIEQAILRAADRLDLAPRRVRAALRDLTAATESANGTLGDLASAAQELDEASANVPMP